jgi:hypothetical protein
LAAAHVPTTSASHSIARSADTILPDKQHTAACTVTATSSADGASFFQPLRHPRHEHLPLQLHHRNLQCHPPSTEEASRLLPRWCLCSLDLTNGGQPRGPTPGMHGLPHHRTRRCWVEPVAAWIWERRGWGGGERLHETVRRFYIIPMTNTQLGSAGRVGWDPVPTKSRTHGHSNKKNSPTRLILICMFRTKER